MLEYFQMNLKKVTSSSKLHLIFCDNAVTFYFWCCFASSLFLNQSVCHVLLMLNSNKLKQAMLTGFSLNEHMFFFELEHDLITWN